MKLNFIFLFFFITTTYLVGQTPTDYLPKEFHAARRDILRSKMKKNTVAFIFSNPVRNRANDVNYVFHQDPNFYYLTGFKEPNSLLIVFSEIQQGNNGTTFNEILYVPKKDPKLELWYGKRLGIEGAKKELGFKIVKNSETFINDTINYQNFKVVYVDKLQDDYRNTFKDKGETYDLVESFKKKTNYNATLFLSKEKKQVYELIKATPITNSANVAQIIGKAITYYPNLKEDEIIAGYTNATDEHLKIEFQQKAAIALTQQSDINITFLVNTFAEMREIKTKEELKLLTKAIKISAIGQIEMMKAMQPHMSELEIQGIHEFVYKKYGAEYEGYPSIVGSGNNGCILHYIENNRTKVDNDLVLMDLGAEYRGYTADVTRTIPANGKFTKEQKAIYELVLKAQNAGIKAAVVDNMFWEPGKRAKNSINQGLADLKIISSPYTKHNYFPHGTSHHIGLDVHDPGTYGTLKENMVITVEPGIYIPEGSPCDKKWWGIAVRIEDDILITTKGPKNLSEDAPRTIEAIERMMTKKSILNEFILPNID